MGMCSQLVALLLFTFGAGIWACGEGQTAANDDGATGTDESAGGTDEGTGGAADDATVGTDTGTVGTDTGIVEGLVYRQGEVDHSGVNVNLNGTDKSIVTDESGSYGFQNVDPGTYTVTASLAGYAEKTSGAFEVRAGETTTVPPLTLEVGSGGLTGFALLDGKDAHDGIVIVVEGTSHATVTDANGAWSIDGVETGNYEIRAAYEGYEDATAGDQEVRVGQVTEVPTLTLYETVSSISGTVTLEGTDRHDGVNVVATAEGNEFSTGTTTTNREGYYRIKDLQPGIYRVEASKPGFGSEVQEGVMVVAAEETSGVNFTLEVSPIGTPNRIIYISGGSNDGAPDQVGTVGKALEEPFVVKVLDSYELPVRDIQVDWQIGEARTEGHMVDVETYTGADGHASNVYVLGQEVGQNQVTVRAYGVGNSNVVFTPQGVPDVVSAVLLLSGNEQSGQVAEALASAIEVEVRDRYNNVIPEQEVTFEPSGDGEADPSSAKTDAAGWAETDWTLGTTAGPQTLTVLAGEVSIDVDATADPDDAESLVKVGGDEQTGLNTTTLANPLVVEVRDHHGNPVPGVTVSFSVTLGSGSLNPHEDTTGSDGRIQSHLTLQALGDLEVTASATGLASVVFGATSVAGVPSKLVLQSEANPVAVVATALTAPVLVPAEDANDNPVEGVTIRFAAGATDGAVGAAVPDAAVADTNGEASTAFTLGTYAGDAAQWLDVTIDDFPTVTLRVNVNAEPDEPASITKDDSTDNQLAAYGQTLEKPLKVHLSDQYDNPVWNYVVNWSSTTGQVSVSQSTTDENGDTSVTATLGTNPGVQDQYFTANANGLSAGFHATATGHQIMWLQPARVWPGYPNAIELKIIGAGFESGASVIWDAGGVNIEFSDAEITVQEDEIIVHNLSPDHLTDQGAYPVTVRNPGPSDCAAEDFYVDYLNLTDSGQDWCTDASYAQVECSTIAPNDELYGQDGHYQPQQTQRHFADNGDGTVTDNVTDLMWMQCSLGQTWSEGPACEGTAGIRTWQDAVDYCDTSSDAGYDDWRLPDRFELSSLVDYGRYNPSIDIGLFPSTPSNSFWSSSTYAGPQDNAWIVIFDTGDVGNGVKDLGLNVRCVRLGPLNLGSFEPSDILGDRVVKDNFTGLMWQGCAAGQNGSDCSNGSASGYTWEIALAFCKGLSFAGYDDWRLPNIAELNSIVDLTTVSPSIVEGVFPGTPCSSFWSSSSGADGQSGAWTLYFDNGEVAGNVGKIWNGNIRCVRLGL